MSQLEKLKIQLDIPKGDTTDDDKLELMLEDAAEDILSWTNRAELPESLEGAQRQLVIIRYNQQGVEGQSAHSEGGISRSFEDLPKGLQNIIISKRLAKLVSYQ